MLESKGYQQSEREPMKDCSVPWCLTHNQASKNCQEMFDHIEPIPPTWTQQPTPTPSITVGTQVRLTGVVTSIYDDGSGEVALRGGEIGTTIDAKEMASAEVIRQPFKRGEVVYGTSSGDTYVVFNDERDGKVDVVDVTAGVSGLDEDATDYERRYERRP